MISPQTHGMSFPRLQSRRRGQHHHLNPPSSPFAIALSNQDWTSSPKSVSTNITTKLQVLLLLLFFFFFFFFFLGTQISTKTCANCCKIFLALCTIGYARVWELSSWTKLDGKLWFLLRVLCGAAIQQCSMRVLLLSFFCFVHLWIWFVSWVSRFVKFCQILYLWINFMGDCWNFVLKLFLCLLVLESIWAWQVARYVVAILFIVPISNQDLTTLCKNPTSLLLRKQKPEHNFDNQPFYFLTIFY